MPRTLLDTAQAGPEQFLDRSLSHLQGYNLPPVSLDSACVSSASLSEQDDWSSAPQMLEAYTYMLESIVEPWCALEGVVCVGLKFNTSFRLNSENVNKWSFKLLITLEIMRVSLRFMAVH